MTTYTQTVCCPAHVVLTCHDCGAMGRLLRRDVSGISAWKREHAAACRGLRRAGGTA